MRSPDAERRTAVVLLLAMAFIFSELGAWSLAERSTIPISLDGTITDIEVRSEKHPGVDDVWIVWINGTGHHLDAAIASEMSVGEDVSKERWQKHLVVDGAKRPVSLSGEARAMLYLSPVMMLLCAALALPRRTRDTKAEAAPVTSPGRSRPA